MPTHAQRLIHAVRAGNHDRLRDLVQRLGDVDARSVARRTALHAACEEGDPEAATFLISSGADVNSRTSFGSTPLHLAAGYGRPWDLMDADLDRRDPVKRGRRRRMSLRLGDAILSILKEGNLRIPEDLGPLEKFAEENRWDLLQGMLESFADLPRLHRSLVDRGVDLAQTDPLFLDMLQGHPRYIRVAQLLIDHGAKVEAVDEQGNTPLRIAVELGRPEMVTFLLDHGANPNLTNEDGQSENLVGIAIEASKINVADLLLERGADFDPGNPENSYRLKNAAFYGQIELVRWLLARGFPIDQQDDKGETPVMAALNNGQPDTAKLLVERGADPTAVNLNGGGLLHAAAGWPESLAFGLTLGLDPNSRDQDGETPLHRAAQSGSWRSVRLLIKAGANPNATNQSGETPLHRIFDSDEFRPDVEFPAFLALVEGGADTSIANNDGETPLGLTIRWNYPDEYRLLLSAASGGSASKQAFVWLGEGPLADLLPSAPVPVEMDGSLWPTCEHYFHAQKTLSRDVRERIRTASELGDAFCRMREGKVEKPVEWPSRCDQIMKDVLLAKIQQHTRLRDALMATGSAILVTDGNCESYWTERPNAGFNVLGKILMEIRELLRSDSTRP